MFLNNITKIFLFLLACMSIPHVNYATTHQVEADLVVQLDDPHIQIGSNFFGEELLIFGAFNNSDLSKSDIIVKVTGTRKSVSVRGKVKKYGIWVNSDNTLVDSVPGYYAIYSLSLIHI